MPVIIPRVFISSTSEFEAERESLKEQIRKLEDFQIDAYSYTAEASGAEPPEERLRGVIENSEIFVLILGDSFGSPYPGRETSIVEWEYEYAKAKKKELKGYVKDPLGPDADPRQKAFVARAVEFREGSWVRKFVETRQMILYAIGDIKAWIIKAGVRWVTRHPERIRWKDRAVVCIGVGAALVTVGGMGYGLLLDIPTQKLMLYFGCCVTTFGSLLLMLKSDVL